MTVIPAKAGIHIGVSNKTHSSLWIPALAGMTVYLKML